MLNNSPKKARNNLKITARTRSEPDRVQLCCSLRAARYRPEGPRFFKILTVVRNHRYKRNYISLYRDITVTL